VMALPLRSFVIEQDVPRILPRCLFAAGRKSFEVTVYFDLSSDEIMDEVFETLPLAEHGWSRNRCTARHRDKNIWIIARS